MPHSYCPCGVLLSQCSTVRPLKSPCLRLFVSIKTAKCVTPETKICNACRTAYYTWKNNYPEFGNILTRIEVDLSNNEAVADKISIDAMEIDEEQESCQISTANRSLSPVGQGESVAIQMNCTFSSHKICCVCRLTIDGSSNTISNEDRDFIFFSKNVFVPEGARCCVKHVNNHRLTMSAIDSIKPSAIQYKKLDSDDVQLIISKAQLLFRSRKRLDFDSTLSLSDDDYKTFTSLSKIEFDDLISQVSKIDMRDSTNRSIRTAIAILLCKLRLGLSNRVLASLFELPDELTISRTIKSARGALMRTFVPRNLGFNHISRREIIEQHTSAIARDLMCDEKSDKAIIVIDGTYIYIQDDVIVVDRGFRDSFNTMKGLGFDVASPPFLNGRRQFTTTEANESRCVTKVRWVVEAVNARLKQFKFLSNTVQNSSIPSLEEYLSIACAIINRYREPIKTPTLNDAEISAKMQALRNQRNTFEKVILAP